MDAMVTDPPAGIGFMGREWDSSRGGRENWVAWMTERLKEAYRLLKPGAHALVWAIPRTSHWTAWALEEAGFEVRDVVTHHFGSGFPKSQDVGKFIDKLRRRDYVMAAVTLGLDVPGVNVRDWTVQDHSPGDMWWTRFKAVIPKEQWERIEREVVGQQTKARAQGSNSALPTLGADTVYKTWDVTAPATEQAKTWDGWGTALKPATEHWILARKPLSESSIARNVLAHGTGALNIDGCRVNRASDDVPGWHKTGAKGSAGYQGEETFRIRDMSPEEIQERCGEKGRWPANLLLSHSETCAEGQCALECPVAELDRQSGVGVEKRMATLKRGVTASMGITLGEGWGDTVTPRHPGSGGASRFFPTFRYVPKPSRREREAGLDALPTRTLNRVNPGGLEDDPRWAPVEVKNNHPTVKSKALMKWLITLVTPKGGWVLDPFAGSGSTGAAALENGFSFFGIEQDADYCRIIEARLIHADAESGGQQRLFGDEEFDGD